MARKLRFDLCSTPNYKTGRVVMSINTSHRKKMGEFDRLVPLGGNDRLSISQVNLYISYHIWRIDKGLSGRRIPSSFVDSFRLYLMRPSWNLAAFYQHRWISAWGIQRFDPSVLDCRDDGVSNLQPLCKNETNWPQRWEIETYGCHR